MLRLLPFLLLAVLSLPVSAVQAESEEGAPEASAAEEPRRGPSGLPLPRFVTLRSSEVNLRTGPGVRYPIDWVFQREGLPIQIIDEFEAWRRVRDRDDTVGWVHQSMLSGRRSVIVIGKTLPLRDDPSQSAGTLAYLEPGFQASLESCPALWCEVTALGPQGQRYRGWLPRQGIWGVLEGETVE
ncbi:MAG: SH3 domain-containing protein [Kiloniellales bacterium]